MIFLHILFALIGTSFCNETEETEVFCPNGWLAHGQVIYMKNISNISHESEYSLCLVCQKSSILKQPFHTIEVCVSTSNLLKNIEMQCKSAICKSKPNATRQHWKLLDQCDTLDYQPVCGMRINMTDKTLKEAMDDVELVFCKNISYQQSFLEDKLYFAVDLVCPQGTTFESVNFKEATFVRHHDSNPKTFCVMCNQKHTPGEVKVSLCSSVLCSPPSSNAIRNLHNVTTVSKLPTYSNESTGYQNVTDVEQYCGFRYIPLKLYFV
jgi:hypothetical protein